MKTWSFQKSSIEGDIEKKLFQNKIIQWSVTRYENEIALGDRAIIWRSEGDGKGYAGIIGIGKIVGQAVLNVVNENHYIVEIEIEELRFSSEEGMILKSTLKYVPELQNLNIFQQDSGSVFKVSDLEASYIDDMWNSSEFENVLYKKRLVNINSSMHVDTLLENYCISKLGYLNNTEIYENSIKNNDSNKDGYPMNFTNVNYWEKIEVYLVDEDLMDEIAPVRSNLSINMECAKRILSNFPNIVDSKEEIIDDLWEKLLRNTSYMKVMGVYNEDVNDNIINRIKRENGIEIREYNVIFICPERVMHWCNNDIDRFHIAFCMLLIHKLMQFYINFNRRINVVYKNNYNEVWGKFFEESLANILAYKRFNCFEKSEIRKLILKKPIEQHACIYWISRDDIEMRNIALAWARMDERAMTNLMVEDSARKILRNESGQCGWKKISTCILKKIIEQ